MARMEVNKQHMSYTTVLTSRYNHPAGESARNSPVGNKVSYGHKASSPTLTSEEKVGTALGSKL